jgi:hypothetical protein
VAATAGPPQSARPWDRGLDRFGLVLAAVSLSIVVLSLVDVGGSYRASLLVNVTNGVALLAAVRACGSRPRVRLAVVTLVAVTVGLGALAAVLEATPAGDVLPPPRGSVSPLWLAAVAVVPALVVRRLAEHPFVGRQTVLGALAAYLQIAVAYAAAYQGLDAVTEPPAFGEGQPTTALMYLSLTTISTLGIGDVVPTSELARLLVASEALLGQLFLVTIVAFVVSRLGAESRRAGPPS